MKTCAEHEPYVPWMFDVDPDLVPPDYIGCWWTRARKASGIDMTWRLHDLRHRSATVSVGQGHDVRTVAGRLGHSNPAMTLCVYAHAFAAADQALAVGLGDCSERMMNEHDLSSVSQTSVASSPVVPATGVLVRPRLWPNRWEYEVGHGVLARESHDRLPE